MVRPYPSLSCTFAPNLGDKNLIMFNFPPAAALCSAFLPSYKETSLKASITPWLMLWTTNTPSHQLQPEMCSYTSKRLTCAQGHNKTIKFVAHAKHSMPTWTGWWHVCGNAPRLAAIKQGWCCRNSPVKLRQKYGNGMVMPFQSHIMYHEPSKR